MLGGAPRRMTSYRKRLIENASAQGLHTEGTTFPEAFPIKASDYRAKWIPVTRLWFWFARQES
jgi:hypothetical protein